MTIDRLHLKDLLEKGSDADLHREIIGFTVNRMMDLEVESLTGAAHGERSAERTNQRDGYRERPWHTGVGTVQVAIPKLRKGSYFPSTPTPIRGSGASVSPVPSTASNLASSLRLSRVVPDTRSLKTTWAPAALRAASWIAVLWSVVETRAYPKTLGMTILCNV